MLSARAYSFRRQSQLAVSLSFVGGYVNAVALMSMGALISHVTGSTTQLGRGIAEGEGGLIRRFGWLVAAFLCGAAASALLTEGARRRGRRSKYLLPVAAEAVLLLVLALDFELSSAGTAAGFTGRYWPAGIAAFAMGMQSAVITKISGGVVRTTHLTGIFTDLGIEGVQAFYWLRDRMAKRRWARAGRVLMISQRHPSFLRLALLASIAGAFLAGATAGTFVWLHRPGFAFAVPVVLLGLIVVTDWRRPVADVRELDHLNDPEMKLHGLVKELLPPALGIHRFLAPSHRARHAAPNFDLWVDRLPRAWRVIILAVSPLTHFDRNAVMDLAAAVRRLHGSGRELIISGLNSAQFKALAAFGILEELDVENLCPDLEFSVARGMACLHQHT